MRVLCCLEVCCLFLFLFLLRLRLARSDAQRPDRCVFCVHVRPVRGVHAEKSLPRHSVTEYFNVAAGKKKPETSRDIKTED